MYMSLCISICPLHAYMSVYMHACCCSPVHTPTTPSYTLPESILN